MAVKRLLVAVATLFSFGFGVAASQAMPFHSTRTGLTIPVASGCGIGVHRGPFDGCNVIYGGHYRAHSRAYSRGYHDGYREGYDDGYYDRSGGARIVDQGACSGRGLHRVCDVYGICWAACN